MRLTHTLRTGARIYIFLTAAFCLCAQEQAPQNAPQNKDTRPKEAQGLAARVASADYQAHAQAGTVTIAADFVGHSVPTAQKTLTTEEYVVVEAAFFGPADARLLMSEDDFSLRINGKKVPLHSQPYGRVAASLKDPDWVPPESEAPQKSSKTSIGGSGQEAGSLPKVVHVPIELQRAMAQQTQRASLALGERPLPQAGLIFFQYRGKVQNITSIELIYGGAAGKATLNLQP
jgi:hypothetical protein